MEFNTIFVCIHGYGCISFVLIHNHIFFSKEIKINILLKVNENKINTGIIMMLSNKAKYIVS